MTKIAAVAVGLMVLFCFAGRGFAQERSPAELDQMLGPIALYPDPLVAEILSASTFPDQIVIADRYISGGGDPNQVDQQPWDPSVQGVAHYPNVLKWLDDNLAWTTQLGQAFAAQQSDVMDSLQRLRAQAQNLGNLPSTPQETVTSDDGDIEIEPTDPDEMYVPDYQPDVIFYQPGVYATFGIGLPIGLWLNHDWDWRNHHVVAWGAGHPRPDNWWHETPGQRHSYIAQGHAQVWRPSRGIAIGNRSGIERGYEPRTISRPVPSPVVPRAPAQNIAAARAESRPAFRPPSTELPHTFARPEPAVRATEPAVRATEPAPRMAEPAIRHAEPAGGVFGGFQSGVEAHASSARGGESRATISPAPTRGGGSSNKR